MAIQAREADVDKYKSDFSVLPHSGLAGLSRNDDMSTATDINPDSFLVRSVRSGLGFQVPVGLKILEVFEGYRDEVKGLGHGGGCVIPFELDPDDATRFSAHGFRCLPICLVVETEQRTEELVEPRSRGDGWYSSESIGWRLDSLFTKEVGSTRLVNISFVRHPTIDGCFKPAQPVTTGNMVCLIRRDPVDD